MVARNDSRTVCFLEQFCFKFVELDVVGCLYTEDRTAENQEFAYDRDCRISNLSQRLDPKQADHCNDNSADEAGNRKTALQACDFYVGHLWHNYLTINTLTKLDEASFRKASVQPGLLNFPSDTVQLIT